MKVNIRKYGCRLLFWSFSGQPAREASDSGVRPKAPKPLYLGWAAALDEPWRLLEGSIVHTWMYKFIYMHVRIYTRMHTYKHRYM